MKQSKKLTPKRKAIPGYARSISRQVWFLYLHSWQVRARLLYIVFTRKYKHRGICEIYCHTYASRKRCEHIINSPWTHLSTAFVAVMFLLVFAQLAYPSDRALPLARLQGHGYVGFQTYRQIADKISGLDSTEVAVRTAASATIASYSEMGLAVDENTTFEHLRTYSRAERIIPFSILVAGNKTVPVNRQVDDAKLTKFIEQIDTTASKRPKDAAIILRDNTKLEVIPAEDGYQSSPEILKQQVLSTTLQDTSIILSPIVITPNISTQTARDKARQMQNRIDTPLIIKAAEASLTADSATLASWVDIVHRPDQSSIDLSFNKSRVESFLKPLPSSVDQPSKPSSVTLLNGLMAGSTQGTSGRVLNFGDLVQEVVNATNPGTTIVFGKVNAILADQTYDRRYSRDNQGIQSLIDYWAETHAGQHGVDFRTVNGRISASVNPYKQFTAASSNKLFIGHLISGRLDAGSLQNTTPTSAGANVASCMDRMLRLSDNSCTVALGNIVGWGNSDTLLRNQGFTDTTLASGGGSTSPNDTSNWFTQLLNGSLTSAGQRDSLINLLSRQNVRTGIPAGSPGIVVADKAGSSRSNVYDTALVYHPTGSYILSVMSDGGSFASIAELATRINRVLSE